MTGFGWHYPLRDQGWADTRTHLEQVNWLPGQAEHLYALIDSVLASGADALLAVSTSMHDLLIAPKPLRESAVDVVRVCAPSHPNLADGMVRIMFVGVDSRITKIEQPVSETVRLFWQFLDTEFGIRRTGQPQD